LMQICDKELKKVAHVCRKKTMIVTLCPVGASVTMIYTLRVTMIYTLCPFAPTGQQATGISYHACAERMIYTDAPLPI